MHWTNYVLYIVWLVTIALNSVTYYLKKKELRGLEENLNRMTDERDRWRHEADRLRYGSRHYRTSGSVSSDSSSDVSKVTVERAYIQALREEAKGYRHKLEKYEKIECDRQQNRIEADLKGKRLLMLNERNEDGKGTVSGTAQESST